MGFAKLIARMNLSKTSLGVVFTVVVVVELKCFMVNAGLFEFILRYGIESVQSHGYIVVVVVVLDTAEIAVYGETTREFGIEFWIRYVAIPLEIVV
jgi:hypothetical protein